MCTSNSKAFAWLKFFCFVLTKRRKVHCYFHVSRVLCWAMEIVACASPEKFLGGNYKNQADDTNIVLVNQEIMALSESLGAEG